MDVLLTSTFVSVEIWFVRLLFKGEYPLRVFFLTVRYGSERFLLFSRNTFDTWTVHLFTYAEQNWSKQFKKKVEFNPTFLFEPSLIDLEHF